MTEPGAVPIAPATLVPVSAEPHLPLPVELPLVDEPGGTDVDLKTQIVRFVLTGALSAVVDFGLYVLLMTAFGVPRDIAKACSFIVGTTTAYLINRRWTFKAEPSRARFVAVVILYAVTFAAQVGMNALLNDVLPAMRVHLAGHAVTGAVLVAFVIAQGTATVINFIVQRAVIFKIH
ncbi:GtrA family protein [Nocardia terpenica]|uniref:GtrA family protein n=1 Tax=Nocardia terpenica TaxID=455432 RepID=A0A6G9YVF6_9NOCA|nr:GtrA family protein [Nocardia terpenica]QIS17081.1 GtrA family protein [Nocardia terpenica]